MAHYLINVRHIVVMRVTNMQCVLSDEQLMQLMRDDVPFGDLTTDLLLNVSREISMTYAARQSMTHCGVEEK